MSRRSSRTACSEIASITPISSPGAKNLRHDAGGGQGDAALRQRQAIAIRGNQQSLLHGIEIVERFTHAHHHDVADLAAFGRHDGANRNVAVREIAKPVAAKQKLGEDFLGRQVADETLRAGVTEGTGQRAADLTGNAERAAALFRNVDGLDLDRTARTPRRKAQQPLAGAVVGDLLLDDIRTRDGEMLLQHLAHVLGDIRHVIEVGDAAHINPVPQLADAHLDLLFRNALFTKRSCHLLAAEADQRGLGQGLGTRLRGRLGNGHGIHDGHTVYPEFKTARILQKPEDLAGARKAVSQKTECGAAVKTAIFPLLRAALASFSPRVTIDGNGKGRHKAGL